MFKSNGYKIVKNLIPKKESKKLYEYCIKRSENKDANLNDEQSIGSPSFYGDKKFKKLQKRLLKRIERESNIKLFSTYTYWRLYKKGSILKSHVDRPACEISISIDIGGEPWELWILNKNGIPIKVDLNMGDGLLYLGCELNHWRNEFKGKNHAQVFLHYVDQFGPNKEWKDDRGRCI